MRACAPGAGFPHGCCDGRSGPQRQDGQPDLPPISSKGLCVCSYIYQPPTDNPLSQLQRSSPEPVCCLGFYHIYILYFFSRACQQRIFKAFPGLREGFAAFTGQAPSTVLPWPGPTRFPSVHPDCSGPSARWDTY